MDRSLGRAAAANPKVTIHKKHTVTSINYDAAKNKINSVTVLDTVNNVSQTVGTAGLLPLGASGRRGQADGPLFPTAFKRAAGLSRPVSSSGPRTRAWTVSRPNG